MKHHTTFSAVICLLLIISLVNIAPTRSAALQSESAEELVENLQEFYRSVDSLTFSFIQTTKGQMVGRPKTGRGNGLFARTESGTKMRWNYNQPDRQIIISDGTSISMYFEELQQMIIAPVDQSQADVLFSFFAGQGNLEDSFTILDTVESAVNGSAVEEAGLKPIHFIPKKSDSQIAMIQLYVTDDNLIRRIELVDHFETRTTIAITNIVVDPFASKQGEEIEQLFSFSPPEGTEIITQ